MKLADILKSPEAEGKEKHVPVIEIGKGKGEGGAGIVHCNIHGLWEDCLEI